MKKEEEKNELHEVYDDIDILMNKVLERLNAQSGIIGASTKLRVLRMFIQQICTGGNKVHFTDELNKIIRKINKMEVSEEVATEEQAIRQKKVPIIVKMPARKRKKK